MYETPELAKYWKSPIVNEYKFVAGLKVKLVESSLDYDDRGITGI